MFTREEAEIFVRNLFEDVLAKGKVDLFKDFYTLDFSGHYLDEIFHLDFLEQKAREIHENKSEYYYKVEDVEVTGDFINITCNSIYIDRINETASQTKQAINWLIKDQKIKESWVIFDKEVAVYKQVNQDKNLYNDQKKMFTPEEARAFIQNRNKDIFVEGRLGLLKNYYTSDFIGHSGDQLFDLEDIKKRVRTINQGMREVKSELQRLMVSGNLITTSVKFTFINKNTNSFYEVLQFNTFLIENRKIKETWMILDQERTYNEMQDINMANYESILLPYEINQKSKEAYLKTLENVLNSEQYRYIRISATEKECLYYYLNGFSAKETAAIMNLSFRTIETYILQIKEKFASLNRLDLRKKLFPESNV